MGGHQRGFTIWELMTTLVVAGIVLGLGVPSFMEFQRSNAMSAAANDVVGAVLLARTEAVKRQLPVTLCLSPAPTAAAPACGTAGEQDNGLIVFVDENGNGVATDASDGNAAVDAGETVLLRRPSPGGTLRLSGDGPYVAYGPNGLPRQPPARPDTPATRFLLCDDRGNRPAAGGASAARVVRIEPTGRPHVRDLLDDVAEAIAAIPGATCTES